jgi:predicted AAA+ superfamily ATPase
LVTDALSAVPVIVVVGPRGVGKTTLVRTLDGKDRKYVSLDDEADLEATRYDPMGFVRRFDRVTIDEVERAPDLLRAIEQSVDSDPRPGRFLLTASANLLSQNDLPPGLASRSEVVTLLPLSQAEIDRQEQSFLKNAFTGNLIEPRNPLIGNELLQTVLTGGYPEMLRRPNFRRRQSWTRDYLKGVFQRDVPEAAAVQKTHELPRLLQVLALHSGQLTNFAQIGAQLGIDDKTTQKYTAVLEQLFLVHRVPAWFQSRLNRLVKTPRLHFLDSGLLAAMLGLAPEKAAENRPAFAALLQTFVLAEILNQITWSDDILTLHHYRDKDRDEVNFLVEHEDGALVGIHVKPGATVYAPDFKGLQKVQNACGEHLKLGVVLYDGTRTVPFGDRLLAAPISCLWS